MNNKLWKDRHYNTSLYDDMCIQMNRKRTEVSDLTLLTFESPLIFTYFTLFVLTLVRFLNTRLTFFWIHEKTLNISVLQWLVTLTHFFLAVLSFCKMFFFWPFMVTTWGTGAKMAHSSAGILAICNSWNLEAETSIMGLEQVKTRH